MALDLMKDPAPKTDRNDHQINRQNNLDFGYPRPQLARQQRSKLNGPWKFRFDVASNPLLDAEIRLKRGEQVLDQCKSYTALRSVEIVRECFPPRRTGAKVRNRFRTSRLGDLARANPRPKSDGPERKLSDLVMALGVIEWVKYGKKFCSYRVHPPLKKGELGDFPMLPYNRRLNLEQQGLKVLRFDDRQVLLQTEAMLETIFQAMKNPS